MDGSSARALPVKLATDEPATLTKLRVTGVDDMEAGSRTRACMRERYPSVRGGAAVERIGVGKESVTFRDASGRGLYACDNTPGPREEGRRWCGGAYGALYGGHLRDPRLDILCQTKDGSLVGFAWVEPGHGTRYVAVRQPGYTEVYEVGGGLPVRVATTTDVDLDRSRATFEISEHDRRGRVLRRYRLEAAVAG